jgi:hypothetical protein
MGLRFTFRLGFAAAAVVVAAVVVPASAQARLQIGSVIAVHNDRSGRCLDADTTTVQLWRCNGSTRQRWRVMHSGRHNYYALRNIRSGRCLDANTTRTQLRECDGQVNQEWAIDLTMTQPQPLVNGFGLGPVLDADPGGTTVRLWHFTDATDQQWYFGR